MDTSRSVIFLLGDFRVSKKDGVVGLGIRMRNACA